MIRTVLAILLLLCSAAVAQVIFSGGNGVAIINTIGGAFTPTFVNGGFSSADTNKCYTAYGTGGSSAGMYEIIPVPCNGMSGSPPTATGTCPIQTQVGGNIAGSFVMNGLCAAGTVSLTFAFTANNGWDCGAHDQTTLGDVLRESGSTPTTVTFSGTTAASDVVSFSCVPY